MAKLILGWKVNKELNPLPFAEKVLSAIEFEDYSDNLVEISPEDLGNHTAIIAQSGSGKSFFIGRLLEEIVLRSNINCFVIDPNADYRNFHLLEIQEVDEKGKVKPWENVYSPKSGLWKITHEITNSDKSFTEKLEKIWSEDVSKKIKIIRGDIDKSDIPYEKIKIFWPDLSSDLFSSGLDPFDKSAFKALHLLVNWFGEILWMKRWMGDEINLDPVAEVYRILNLLQNDLEIKKQIGIMPIGRINSNLSKKLEESFESEYKIKDLLINFKALLEKSSNIDPDPFDSLPISLKSRYLVNNDFDFLSYIIGKLESYQYFSNRVLDFYEGKYKELSSYGYSVNDPLTRTRFDHQLTFLDLPSFEYGEARNILLGKLLDDIWDQARYEWSVVMSKANDAGFVDFRKPKIILIDEAHNIAPLEVENQSENYIREKLRTIAAEGRKYGLFLCLISQRPDKLDPKILSECKNIGVMKLNNQSTIDSIQKIFGLEEYQEELKIARKMKAGRIMFFGDWADEQGMLFYGTARRTKEGGKKIPKKNFHKD